MKNFKQIAPTEISDNVFKLIGTDWMLITAGEPKHFNTMTASWGGLGVLWGKNVCWCVIRPQRYTLEFLEKTENFTLSFFGEEQREALRICGSKSGREINKMQETGLTPIAGAEADTTAFDEARLVLTCKKLYFQDIDPKNLLDSSIIDKCYPDKDFHRMFIAEITQCWSK